MDQVAEPARTPEDRRRLQLEAELKRFVTIVSHQMQPERIVLFGSLAKGHVAEWSDLDLVVIAATDEPFYERLRRIVRWVQPQVGMDVLVYTPSEWQQLQDSHSNFRREVEQQGRVVYERRQ